MARARKQSKWNIFIENSKTRVIRKSICNKWNKRKTILWHNFLSSIRSFLSCSQWYLYLQLTVHCYQPEYRQNYLSRSMFIYNYWKYENRFLFWIIYHGLQVYNSPWVISCHQKQTLKFVCANYPVLLKFSWMLCYETSSENLSATTVQGLARNYTGCQLWHTRRLAIANIKWIPNTMLLSVTTVWLNEWRNLLLKSLEV